MSRKNPHNKANPLWTNVCSSDGCDAAYYTRGLCRKHYYWARKDGDIERLTFSDRFWMKVDKRGPDECWNWIGGLNMTGYGVLRHQEKNLLAHRVALHLATGAVEINTQDRATDLVLHSCDNKRCCNPKHLEPGTPLKNAQDREERSGYVPLRGEQIHGAKLNEEQVIEIRRNTEASATELAKRFGVTIANISNIRHGIRWKHVVVPNESRSAV